MIQVIESVTHTSDGHTVSVSTTTTASYEINPGDVTSAHGLQRKMDEPLQLITFTPEPTKVEFVDYFVGGVIAFSLVGIGVTLGQFLF